jgi:hypothetical protein
MCTVSSCLVRKVSWYMYYCWTQNVKSYNFSKIFLVIAHVIRKFSKSCNSFGRPLGPKGECYPAQTAYHFSFKLMFITKEI